MSAKKKKDLSFDLAKMLQTLESRVNNLCKYTGDYLMR